MKLSELKAEVYRIAKVATTRQLKKHYANIKPLDMRYKASWESALEQVLKTAPVRKKVASKKKKTQQHTIRKRPLKTSKSERKDRKQDAATPLARTKAFKAETLSDFDNWLSHPPDEYKALFAEAESALGAIDTKLDNVKQLTKTARAMAESLDEFAEASVAEATQLMKNDQRDRNRSKQADFADLN